MSIPGSAEPLLLAQQDTGGYQIQRSLRFNSSDSAYLSRTPASAGNRKTWTLSLWLKRTKLGQIYEEIISNTDSSTVNGLYCGFTGDAFQVAQYTASFDWNLITTQVFRDTSSWGHLLVAADTTQATASNRIKVYWNGVQITSFSTQTYPTQNLDINFNTAVLHAIGRFGSNTTAAYYANMYMADVHFIDGQALTPSSFTEVSATTGQLIPKAYTGTFTGNSFWLKFADNSAATATTLGKDSSGLGNNWTPNNLSVTAGAGNDSLVDTPTSYGTDTGAGSEVRGNYCTLNQLNRNSNANLSNGNLNFSLASAGVNYGTFATFGVRTGKWYFEASIDSFISYGITTGFVTSDWGKDYIGSGGTAYFGLDTTQGRRSSAGITAAGSTVTYGAGDVVGVAFDADAGTATIYKNGASVYTFSGIPANDYFPALSSGGSSAWINFGQRPFAYTAPSGFKALCDTNLPAPVVAKSSDYFQTVLYTGNDSTQTISGLGFSPDLVWTKCRSFGLSHIWMDTVRGTGVYLRSNNTGVEESNANVITSFDSTGFTLGSSSAANLSPETFAAWCWDAGSSTVTNTQGSITSQVRANASAGFSIVTYTGTGGTGTVGHGLGVTPSMIIVKNRSNSINWAVAHAGLSSNRCLNLNTTSDDSTVGFLGLDKSSFTSTTFTVNYSDTNTTVVNGSSNNYVAYCFAPVAGYSSFGSYTGNGSTDGPFVFCGFRPRWVMWKNTTSAGSWYIHDSARSTYNVTKAALFPNLSDSENSTYSDMDILSNGFKQRRTDSDNNASGNTYVWAAFAESPFQYARAR